MVATSVREAAAPAHKRFLASRPEEYETYLRAARDYVASVGSDLAPWLYRKPYDDSPGNSYFYLHFYNVLNILKVMEIQGGAAVLEVGSGPGWLTEILFCMGFEVFALEPSEEMIRVARDRIAACTDHHRIKNPPRVTFLCESLEECSLPDESVDAVLFHEALHHVVDEERGMVQCARVLRRNGVLGVTGEGSWAPGRREMEDTCREEMQRYGTLENPYTAEYLEVPAPQARLPGRRALPRHQRILPCATGESDHQAGRPAPGRRVQSLDGPQANLGRPDDQRSEHGGPREPDTP